jgi:Flp pilus assembly protein TadG
MMRRLKAARRIGRDEAGAAAVEFATVSLALILVCLAMVEFGRGLYLHNQLSYAADLAAREIMLKPQIQDDELEAAIRQRFIGAEERLEVSAALEDGVRTVQLNYSFTLLLKDISGEPM